VVVDEAHERLEPGDLRFVDEARDPSSTGTRGRSPRSEHAALDPRRHGAAASASAPRHRGAPEQLDVDRREPQPRVAFMWWMYARHAAA
jgi:hypothetical protein